MRGASPVTPIGLFNPSLHWELMYRQTVCREGLMGSLRTRQGRQAWGLSARPATTPCWAHSAPAQPQCLGKLPVLFPYPPPSPVFFSPFIAVQSFRAAGGRAESREWQVPALMGRASPRFGSPFHCCPWDPSPYPSAVPDS